MLKVFPHESDTKYCNRFFARAASILLSSLDSVKTEFGTKILLNETRT